MTLDVVVVTHQSRPFLQDCLGRLPADANVIVVDNASTDRSGDEAKRWGAKVVVNQSNTGFAAAANQGARLGAADVILFLNPDACLDAASLGRLLDTLAVDDRVAIAGPRLVHPDGREQRAWWPFPKPSATWAEAFGLHLLRHHREPEGGDVPFVVGACMAVRRRAFDELGGFDERFWLYGEEADLAFRARQRGWAVVLVPEATARHEGGASGEGAPAEAFEHFQRGTEYFILKHYGAGGLVSHRLGLLLGSLARMALRRERRWIVKRLVPALLTRPTRVEAR